MADVRIKYVHLSQKDTGCNRSYQTSSCIFLHYPTAGKLHKIKLNRSWDRNRHLKKQLRLNIIWHVANNKQQLNSSPSRDFK